jgi:ATP-dependent DNA helicase RecG
LVATTDGFELAERDLEIRGEGQLLGARQSGYSDLRFVRLRRDQKLLERARDVARAFESEGLLTDEVDCLLGEAEHLGES